MNKEEKMIYVLMAQTDEVTVTAQTKKAVTIEEAQKDIHIVTGNYMTNKYIILPIASQESWERGYINFCPRCGRRQEFIEKSYSFFECHDCNAEIECNITVQNE